ncbi:hypothetical protein [Aestuariirhabdus litorea]|uniref:Uncharacterized protein n=1 Tax=Aestuariirhabdus litorea TaxID=2528527 RepID=A0A3P3VPZ8_9GAMM|nr:hypothetical protein [Aestuariirhabdus litorea]RRJ83746.1 hypothetical protein D0544_01080 [Aestuariirhabdus litorea]RWW96969.1 hypothetical protein DZC74_01080 [Endozoicomonadaceae bacterium GTF-13]
MKTKLAINIFYLALYAGFNGLVWLLFQQIPFSVAAQFLAAPLVIMVGAVLIYLPYESALKKLEASSQPLDETATVVTLAAARTSKVQRPAATVAGAAPASLAAH